MYKWAGVTTKILKRLDSPDEGRYFYFNQFAMTTEQLNEKVTEVKQQISKLCIDFKKETGFTICEINVAIIDAQSKCGPEWVPGTVDISIQL